MDDLARRIEQLEAQERELVFSRFDDADAWALGTAARALAADRGLPITIDIVKGDHQVFHAALPGTSAEQDLWIRRKANTARRFGWSSYLVRLRHEVHGLRFEDLPHNDGTVYSASGGAFPIIVDGVGVVGMLTISGLTEEQDHDFAVEALRQHAAESLAGQ